MERIIIVTLILLLGVTLAPAQETLEEAREQQKEINQEYNLWRWQKYHQLRMEYLDKNEDLKDIYEKENNSRKLMEAYVREEIEKIPEGKELYAQLDQLNKEMEELQEKKDYAAFNEKRKEATEIQRQIKEIDKENQVSNWSNEAYRPYVQTWQKATSESFDVFLEMAKESDDPKLQEWHKGYIEAKEKKEAIDAKVKELTPQAE
ncbi:MAG: hypothetical protein ACOCVL_00925 [Candidatus Sumerlaeota bacterium]